MSVRRYPVTPEGHARIVALLRNIREVQRPANIKSIEIALDHGDLSENAEYHAAKEKQGILAAQMNDLEDKLSRAQIIDPATLDLDRIAFGATVTLLDLETDDEVCYQIVGSELADAGAGRISCDAPLSRALIGREEGDEVVFRAPKV
jgi:transcription elongation factor GreA